VNALTPRRPNDGGGGEKSLKTEPSQKAGSVKICRISLLGGRILYFCCARPKNAKDEKRLRKNLENGGLTTLSRRIKCSRATVRGGQGQGENRERTGSQGSILLRQKGKFESERKEEKV